MFFLFLKWIIVYICIGGMISVLAWKLRPQKWEGIANIYIKELFEEKKAEVDMCDLKKMENKLLILAKIQISIVLCLSWPLTALFLFVGEPEG